MCSPQPGPSGLRNVDSDEERDWSKFNKNLNKRRKMYMIDSDDSKMEFEGNSNTNYEQTESEDDNETTFEDKSSESDEEFEYGELDELFEDAKYAGEWICDGDFKQFPFDGEPGFKIPPKGSGPHNLFQQLLDDNFFSMIVTESNKYAESKKGNQWKKLTVTEFRKFLGLLLHMGTIKCSRIQNYWSTHRLFNFNCFSQHMSRNRFQDILRSLHFSSNDGNSNHLSKVQPIIDYFNNKMKAVYYPHKELSINEKTVPWRGRLGFRQYIPGKKHKHGIKLYIVTESSGIALQIEIYLGKGDNVSGKRHATNVVVRSLQHFLQIGHSVFMQNFNTSFTLSEYLSDSKMQCSNTVQKCTNGNSKEGVMKKLSKDEATSQHENKIRMDKFQDNRDVLLISSKFKPNLGGVDTKRKDKLRKPLVLHKYNEFMNGIDKIDQMLSYYTCSRRTFKWYTKLWINIVETLLLNSFFLYSKYLPVTNKLNFYDFRVNVIDTLLFENYQESVPQILPDTEHMPEILPRGKYNKIKRKRCRHCFAHNVRKETNYFCGACEDNPGLCLGNCFREFHRHK